MKIIQTVGGYRDEKGHRLDVYRQSGLITFVCSVCRETVEERNEITKDE